MWTFDADRRLTFVNARMVAMLRYDEPADLLGMHVDEFLDPDQRAAAAARDALRRSGVGGQVEVRLRRRDGAAPWVLVETTPAFGPDGRFERVLAMAMDVTERRLAEQALRSSEARYHAHVECVPDVIRTCEADRRGGEARTIP